MNTWFQTWDRSEYQEWAKKIPQGYLLVILRKEPKKFLCVKAKLLMGDTGLPGFEIVEEKRFAKKQKAENQIDNWKN